MPERSTWRQPSREKIQAREKVKSKFEYGLELIKNHGFELHGYPEALADNEEAQDAYDHAKKVLNKAYQFAELLGGNITSEHAAQVVQKMGQELREAHEARDETKRNELAEKLAIILGIYRDHSKIENGIGSELGILTSGIPENRDALIERIRSTPIPKEFRQAIAYNSEK